MSKSKKRNSSRGQRSPYKIIPQTGYEGRPLFKAGAFIGAVGLSFAAVLGTVPQTVVNTKAVTVSEPMVAYVQEAPEETIYTDGTLATLEVPELEEEAEIVKAIFEDSVSDEDENEIDFSKYTTSLSEEEMTKKLTVAKNTTASGYVRFNRDGIPMSEMTAPEWLTLDENGVPTDYAYCITGKATAYYSGTHTATGTRVRQGSVAVDPKEIPYGTEMWITSSDGSIVYGYCRAEDTGGFAEWEHGATVDLYMRAYDDCVKWGWRGVNVYILNSK